jgi:hypothetical protein
MCIGGYGSGSVGGRQDEDRDQVFESDSGSEFWVFISKRIRLSGE